MADREKYIEVLSKLVKKVKESNENAPIQINLKCIEDILELLKEQEAVVRCKDCKNWIPGYITDQDDFIPPKCGKYQQMVGHSADDFCSLAEKQEGR